jgi:hypothetical protein
MAEREGFEPNVRLEAKSRINADLIECHLLESGDKKQQRTSKGSEKQE